MAALLAQILADKSVMASITHNTNISSAGSEIEVGLEPYDEGHELVGKAVVDVLAPERVKLDKAKLTKLIRGRPEADEWPDMKIAKRQVPQNYERPDIQGDGLES